MSKWFFIWWTFILALFIRGYFDGDIQRLANWFLPNWHWAWIVSISIWAGSLLMVIVLKVGELMEEPPNV